MGERIVLVIVQWKARNENRDYTARKRARTQF
jgi:hypothetical protein